MYLREYLYVDIDKVRSFAGQLMEGIPEEARSTEKKAKQLSLGVKSVAGSNTDWSVEDYVNRSLTDSLFGNLEEILESEGWLVDISDHVRSTDTDLGSLQDLYPPAQLIRITCPGVLFDARFVARVLGGLAAASDGLVGINASLTKSAASGSPRAGKKQRPDDRRSSPLEGSLEAEVEDFDSTLLKIDASQLRSLVKLARGVFTPGVHLMLTPRKDDIAITARLQEGRKYLETDSEILFSRYGTAQQEWTLVGSIGTYGEAESPQTSATNSFTDGDERVSRPKFATFVNSFLQLVGNKGLADVPQYPGFSVVPLAVYRTIVNGGGVRSLDVRRSV
ncbi:DUF6414 family protein [Saccharothrix stipae]